MIFEIIAFSVLTGLLVYREYLYRKDVEQLLNRLMARNFGEYVAVTVAKPKEEPRSLSDYEEYVAECKKKGIEPEKEIF